MINEKEKTRKRRRGESAEGLNKRVGIYKRKKRKEREKKRNM